MNVNRITDNNKFWRVVTPNFSNKIVGTNRLVLRDGGKTISDTEKVADTFNKCFVNIGNTLKIDKDNRFLVETNDELEARLKAIKKYSTHSNILNIKEKMTNKVFSFRNVTYAEILNELTAWTLKNQHSQTIFSLKIINEIIKLQNFNKCIIDRKFPDQLKKKTLVLSLKKETIMIKPTIGR